MIPTKSTLEIRKRKFKKYGFLLLFFGIIFSVTGMKEISQNHQDFAENGAAKHQNIRRQAKLRQDIFSKKAGAEHTYFRENHRHMPDSEKEALEKRLWEEALEKQKAEGVKPAELIDRTYWIGLLPIGWFMITAGGICFFIAYIDKILRFQAGIVLPVAKDMIKEVTPIYKEAYQDIVGKKGQETDVAGLDKIEKRLQKLEQLYQDKLITEAEYLQKRKEIVDEI